MTERHTTTQFEDNEHKKGKRVTSRRVLTALATLAAASVTAGVAASGERPSLFADQVTDSQSKQFQDILQPTTIDVAEKTIKKVEALQKSDSYVKGVEASTYTDPEHPDDVTVRYEAETPDHYNQIVVETKKDDQGNPDPTQVYALEVSNFAKQGKFVSLQDKVFAGSAKHDGVDYWNGVSAGVGSSEGKLDAAYDSVVYDKEFAGDKLDAAQQIAQSVAEGADRILADK